MSLLVWPKKQTKLCPHSYRCPLESRDREVVISCYFFTCPILAGYKPHEKSPSFDWSSGFLGMAKSPWFVGWISIRWESHSKVTALLGGFVSANLYQKLGGEKWAWFLGPVWFLMFLWLVKQQDSDSLHSSRILRDNSWCFNYHLVN